MYKRLDSSQILLSDKDCQVFSISCLLEVKSVIYDFHVKFCTVSQFVQFLCVFIF